MAKMAVLLRSVNVGGRTVKMETLRALFERLGFTGVETYIQSGNVVFEPQGEEPEETMRTRIEGALERVFGFVVATVLLTADELDQVIAANPYAGVTLAGNERVHVTVFQASPSPASVSALKPEPGTGDEFSVAGRAAYILCRGGYAHTPYSNPFFEKKLKVKATTRNLDTMLRLKEMCG